jgi:uncharacterized Ntn-hydrolase superfamily protein
MFGVAITTSSISVGSRCPHARAGVGAVATQNITDPALGPALLDQLELGNSAGQALDNVLDGLPNTEFRQLTVIDNQGTTACHTGDNILGIHAISAGNGCFAAGNLLANDAVPGAMTSSFHAHDQLHLAPRLLKALQAGLVAGGEQGNVHSAALLVVDTRPFPLVDLRVDWDDIDPVHRLNSIWNYYEPQMQDYLIRAIDPGMAPSYGVPGDL